ncbi:hypothetical protein B0H10DRAFT_2347077 [Mycena sp. CBHHK59/15]|nr:hypothetical protein B0H10DRAFT_2347077 [Mycena sp. CBHHK59/15]
MDEDFEFLFVDEPHIEPDDSQNHLGNEEDSPLIPDDDADLQELIHRSNSRYLRDKIAPGDLRKKVLNVLAAMKTEGINLPIFLDALCWGDEACISDGTIRLEGVVACLLKDLLCLESIAVMSIKKGLDGWHGKMGKHPEMAGRNSGRRVEGRMTVINKRDARVTLLTRCRPPKGKRDSIACVTVKVHQTL